MYTYKLATRSYGWKYQKMSSFYSNHLAFKKGCFEAILTKNTICALGVKVSCASYVLILVLFFPGSVTLHLTYLWCLFYCIIILMESNVCLFHNLLIGRINNYWRLQFNTCIFQVQVKNHFLTPKIP